MMKLTILIKVYRADLAGNFADRVDWVDHVANVDHVSHVNNADHVYHVNNANVIQQIWDSLACILDSKYIFPDGQWMACLSPAKFSFGLG